MSTRIRISHGRLLLHSVVLAACVAGASLVMVASGCVEQNPIVTGNRDAAVDARPVGVTVVPLDDGPDDDGADCRYCGETLSTDTARGTLCRKNGDPSSTRKLNALVDCICYDKCVQECGSYCSGSKQTSPCQQCVIFQCLEPYNTCVADVRQ